MEHQKLWIILRRIIHDHRVRAIFFLSNWGHKLFKLSTTNTSPCYVRANIFRLVKPGT
jgi:hypothetical protein